MHFVLLFFFLCILLGLLYFVVFPKDLRQYFTNLTEANILGAPHWKLEYQATSVFGVPDVTTQSLHRLAESFKENDSANFKKYYKFNSVSLDEICDDKCKMGQICAITKVDFDQLKACLSTSEPPTSDGNPVGLPCLAFLLLVAAIPIFLGWAETDAHANIDRWSALLSGIIRVRLIKSDHERHRCELKWTNEVT